MEHKEYRKLHAEWYEYVSDAGPDLEHEVEFWSAHVRAAGQPVLELGSGTGKILIRLLEKGFDVTGIDTSPDMMERCRARCQDKGLELVLYEQSMLDFQLPRQFSLIILPSASLSLFTRDDEIRSLMRCVTAHLKPGGTFVYGFQQIPPQPDKNSNNWTGSWVRGPERIVLTWRRDWRYDPASHIWECLFIIEKFIDGHLVATEANERVGRYFAIEEGVSYARDAGFENMRLTHELTDRPPSPESAWITVCCKKPLTASSND